MNDENENKVVNAVVSLGPVIPGLVSNIFSGTTDGTPVVQTSESYRSFDERLDDIGLDLLQGAVRIGLKFVEKMLRV